MTWLMLIQSALSAIRVIAGHSELAETLGIEKYSKLIDTLLHTALIVIDRGEEGIADLKKFTEQVNELRARVQDGGRIQPSEIDGLKAESDDLHSRLQALRAAAPVRGFQKSPI